MRKKAAFVLGLCVMVLLFCMVLNKLALYYQINIMHSHDFEYVSCIEVVIVEVSEGGMTFKKIDDIEDTQYYEDYMVRRIIQTKFGKEMKIRDEWGNEKEVSDLKVGQRARICVCSDVIDVLWHHRDKPYYKENVITYEECYEILIR